MLAPDRIALSFPAIRSRDGHRLPAVLLEPPAPQGGAVVSHGYGGTKEDMLGLALALAVRGWATIAIDLRGHGAHPAAVDAGFLDDVNGALDQVRHFGETVAVGHSFGGRLALASEADRAIGISPSIFGGISAAGQAMMEAFTAPRVREQRPGYLLEVATAIPAIRDDGKPRLVVYSEADVPGILAGLQALSLSNLQRVAVPPLYAKAPHDPRLLDYLPAWFNHADTRVNPQALDRVLAWLSGTVDRTA